MRKTKSDGSFSHIEHKLSLTIDAAKMFAMLAQTDQGKIVRQYFLQVEKEYKQLIRQQQSPIVFNSCWEQRGVPFLRNTQIPAGYWGIYSELFFIFKNLEDSGFPLPERAVLDMMYAT